MLCLLIGYKVKIRLYTVCGLLLTNIDISSQSESENAEDEIREAFQVFDGVRFFTKVFHITIARLKTSSSYYNHWTKSQLVNVHVQDGNGFINRQELAVVMGNLGESLTQEEIQVYLGTSLTLSTPPAFDNNQN